MTKYKYLITDSSGKEKKGVIEAQSESNAAKKLQSDGSIVLQIEERKSLGEQSWNIQFGTGVKTKDIVIFCRQFYSILEAGVSVIEGLRMIKEQTENKFLKKAVANVQTNVEKGESLATAMEMEKKIFPSILINMVAAGESTGNLEVAFKRITLQLEKDMKLKSMLVQAMIYPMIVLVVAVGVVIIMMIMVIPNFEQALGSAGIDLPLPTRIVMGLSEFMVNNVIWVIGGLIGLVAAIVIFKGTETGKLVFGIIALKIPMFRNFSIKNAASKFSMTLSTLISAGVPLVEAIHLVANVVENRVIRKSLMNAKEEVTQGIPLSEPLEAAGIFPPMVYHMIKIGEETGNTEEMLDKISDFYEDEVTAATKALTTMMEPVILIVLAVVVGGVIMAILMPMMSIYQAAG